MGEGLFKFHISMYLFEENMFLHTLLLHGNHFIISSSTLQQQVGKYSFTITLLCLLVGN